METAISLAFDPSHPRMPLFGTPCPSSPSPLLPIPGKEKVSVVQHTLQTNSGGRTSQLRVKKSTPSASTQVQSQLVSYAPSSPLVSTAVEHYPVKTPITLAMLKKIISIYILYICVCVVKIYIYVYIDVVKIYIHIYIYVYACIHTYICMHGKTQQIHPYSLPGSVIQQHEKKNKIKIKQFKTQR